jgi:hypothetical protein
MYGCESLSLTFRDLRRIFEPLRDEITGKWRKLYYEKLHNF